MAANPPPLRGSNLAAAPKFLYPRPLPFSHNLPIAFRGERVMNR